MLATNVFTKSFQNLKSSLTTRSSHNRGGDVKQVLTKNQRDYKVFKDKIKYQIDQIEFKKTLLKGLSLDLSESKNDEIEKRQLEIYKLFLDESIKYQKYELGLKDNIRASDILEFHRFKNIYLHTRNLIIVEEQLKEFANNTKSSMPAGYNILHLVGLSVMGPIVVKKTEEIIEETKKLNCKDLKDEIKSLVVNLKVLNKGLNAVQVFEEDAFKNGIMLMEKLPLKS